MLIFLACARLPYTVGGQGNKLIVYLQNHQFHLLEALHDYCFLPEEAFVRRTLTDKKRRTRGAPSSLKFNIIVDSKLDFKVCRLL
ncbi:hypothetical protein VNO77_24999 [Canavalia gladiata]|uniref:Uncharacterized protein n=1 Tax=Canavalia gladiata TaxID=3824 RepID=A0AAN9QD82_CANGL